MAAASVFLFCAGGLLCLDWRLFAFLGVLAGFTLAVGYAALLALSVAF